jgi:large subunit ribosomal protein L10
MNREQKAAVIDEIAGQIESAEAIFAVDYRGISVPQAAELRTKLRAADATFAVVKNSLTERAVDKAGAELLKEFLQGPTALTFVRGDAAVAAKAIADQARATQLLPFKGGLLDGAAVSAEQISAIARLPARQVLHGQLVGLVASPISGLVRTLNALVGGLAIQLGGLLEKKQSGEIPSGEAPPCAAQSDEADVQTDAEPATQTDEAPVETQAKTEPEAPAAEPSPTETDDEAVSAEDPAGAEASADAPPGDDTETSEEAAHGN